MFGKRNPHRRSSSNNIAPPPMASPVEAPAVSPLQMVFDFELQNSSTTNSNLSSPFSPVSPNATFAPPPPTNYGPSTHTGTARKAHGGLQLLPHIPSVALRSNSSSAQRTMAGEWQDTGWNAGDTLGRVGGDGGGGEEGGGGGDGDGNGGVGGGGGGELARSKSVLSRRLSVDFQATTDVDLMPLSTTPLSGTLNERPKTAHGGGSSGSGSTTAFKMEASLFPQRSDTPTTPNMPPPPSPPLPSMNRSFIDSRDKPYSPPAKPPTSLQSNHSSPNLPDFKAKTPMSQSRGPAPVYNSKNMIRPQVSLQNLSRRSNYSGSTARPSTHTSSKTALSAGAVTTIGTPYASTADSFPLPQHVKTRPKTLGATSSVAGVTVPTHHTSAIKSSGKRSSKSDSRKSEVPRKKGRLLNPMHLLQRRRSSQDPEAVEAERANREAQAQALARQKDVLASGINIPPPDFDPRIKGKLIHDFSAPRDKRNTFGESDMPQPPSLQQSPSNGDPMSPSFPPRHASLVNRGPRDGQRRSTHTPVFKENLDETPESSKRISSIHAESLENKEFLQRVSKHSNATAQSQESAILPPFARRSQMLDPMQASFFHDDDSKRSSDSVSQRARDSSLSDVGEVSPVTIRSSGHDAISPISPGPTSPQWSRPVSHINTTLAHDRISVTEFNGGKASTSDSHRRFPNEKISRPYSVVLAPPQVDTMAEGSSNNAPIEPLTGRARAQEPQYLARGLSIRNTPSPRQAEAANLGTQAAHSLLEKSAGFPTPDHTPELLQDANVFHTRSPPPNLVEKRKSAAGHSRKSSVVPRKHASNASRFSFQFGGESAAQEQALEEKHRKIVSQEITGPIVRGASPDEDEEDYFDEDAMDDMDELEMQASSEEEPYSMLHPQSKPGDGSISNAGTSQSSLYLQQARQALQQPGSDDGSNYDDDEIPQVTDEHDIPYADHPAFRAHSAMGDNSRHNSVMTDTPDGYWRDSTIDSYMRDSYYPPTSQSHGSRLTPSMSPGQSGGYAQDYLSALDRDSLRFPRPQSTLNVPGQASRPISTALTHKPALPHRDSGNSERNRAVSGFSFSTPGATPSSEHVDPLGNGSAQSRVVSGLTDVTISDNMPHAKGGLYARSGSPNLGAGSQTTRDHLPQLTSISHSHPTSVSVDHQEDLTRNTSANAPRLISSPIQASDLSAKGTQESEETVGSSSPRHPRNGSASVLNLASPSRSALSKESIDSDLSFEDFARATSPKTPGDGQFDHIGFAPVAPTLSKGETDLQRIGSASSKASTSPGTSAGLGMSGFADFDFGQQFTSMLTGTTIIAASDSEDETDDDHAENDTLVGPVQDAVMLNNSEIVTARHASRTSLGSDQNSRGVRAGPEPGTEVSLSSAHASPASAANASTVLSCMKSRGFIQQHFGSPPLAHSPPNEHPRFATLSSPTNISKTPDMPSAGESLRNQTSPETGTRGKQLTYDDCHDDLYFDDGNFDDAIPTAGGFDESAFDDDSFLYRPNAAVNALHGYGHRQQNSNMCYHSIGSDGPYPSLAVSNASKVLAKNSQLMLQDLPIQASVDPKHIPQRNPSEDARRLGLSDRAPPVPAVESNPEAIRHMQESLQKYHAALAGAANRAASEGRFVRQPSIASTVASSIDKPEPTAPRLAIDTQSVRDNVSMYSQDEGGGEIHMPYGQGNGNSNRVAACGGRSSHATVHSQPKLSFDFGFDQSTISDFGGDLEDDDDLVAAANAEVLASDDEGFYGQEFDFYSRPRANSGELQAINGGYWGPDGDDGLQRNKSSREPNLTPITERSEFSTRNSFVAGMPGLGVPGAGGFAPQSPALSRIPITPLMENDITSFDDLRRLRAQAFGGSNRSDKSNSNRSSQQSLGMLGPSIDTNVGSATGQGYLNSSPMQYGYSNGSNGSSNPSSAKPLPMDAGFNFHDSPQSATSSNGNSFALDFEATPKRNQNSTTEPVTAKKGPPRMMSPTSPKSPHSRSGSGADSINYVQEPDPEGSGRPRWVLERRRTSEQGQLELVGRELVQGGWI